jgi:hypothetical protein
LSVEINRHNLKIANRTGVDVSVEVMKNDYLVKGNATVEIEIKETEAVVRH